MKASLIILNIAAILYFTGFTSFAQDADKIKTSLLPGHPRILLLEGEEAGIKKTIASDIYWKKTHQFILDECNKIIAAPPVERELIGKRLLDKSREALRRVFFLSYAWRITSEAKYLERAEKELLAVSSFSDWNPSHFLDVAEMTMAVSIGYDWLYKGLPARSGNIIQQAIIEKGLKPSLEANNNSWVTLSNNWNQVCNAGMTFGALAIYEDQPELAQNLINRAINSIKLPMEGYQPDGAYPEGYNYWDYGTTFNVMFLSAMEKAFGLDYRLTNNPGFFKTAGYLENMSGPSGISFNYSDARNDAALHPAMFWLANRLNDPSLLWSEKYFLTSKPPPDDRLLPAVMIWNTGILIDKITPPLKTVWIGQGKNPVALMRTSWTDPNAIYVALKCGSPSVSHGHMDVGSFIMDADGERWAMDIGMQEYESLESAGVNLWGMQQNSQRWEVFRYNNFIHNTLTVNNQLQDVQGYASITSFSDKPEMMNAITDITSVYKGHLNKATRGIAIIDKKYVTVRDEIEAASAETVIRWNLLSSAEVRITNNNTAMLTINGKRLTLKVMEPAGITLKTWSTVPGHAYDAPNPGTVMVGFEVKIPADTKVAFTVLLIPGIAVENTAITTSTLASWPKTSWDKYLILN